MQLLKFIVVGCSCVFLDWLVYQALTNLGFPVDFAKMIGVTASVVVSFCLNYKFVFNALISTGVFFKYILTYLISIGLNVLVNSTMVTCLPSNSYNVEGAFITATLFSAIFNFISLKLYVFKESAVVK